MERPCKLIMRIFFLLAFFLQAFFISCSRNVVQFSFTSSLDQIDAFINQNQYVDAEKELAKIEKIAQGSWAEIGIFRRYKRVGNYAKAEKILKNSIKKNPANLELNAVYSNFLLRQKRFEEAVSVGKILQGSKYGSIYSEAVLSQTLNKSEENELSKVFHSSDFYSVYYDAFTGTKDNAWLRNCALLGLASGEYAKVSALRPGEVYGADDAYFWAISMYDGECYADSINYAEIASKLLKNASGRALKKVSAEKIASLISDCFICLSDAERAEEVREKFLDSIQDYNGKWKLSDGFEQNEKLPVMFVNSAKWSRDNLEEKRCANLLSFCVDNWPDYVPALCAYADFSVSSNQNHKEDKFSMELRDSGLATLEMEKYDSRAKIPLSDAIYRIDQSLQRKKDPLLYIVRLDIRYKTEKKLSEKEKTADIWRVLEENMLSPGIYDEILLNYAESFFLNTRQYADAWRLFYNYIAKKYNISADSKFWENIIQRLHSLSEIELEFAAYFSALSLRVDDSLCLYEAAVFAGAASNGYVSTSASDVSCMNLGMIYNSLGMKQMALDLYGKVNGRSSNLILKSEALYRMALIYYKDNDAKNARRCAEYAVSLNRKNQDARFLLAKIKSE